jgi:hypothetical protein
MLFFTCRYIFFLEFFIRLSDLFETHQSNVRLDIVFVFLEFLFHKDIVFFLDFIRLSDFRNTPG